MTKTILTILALLSLILMIASLFTGGHIRLLGFPISGVFFYCAVRYLLEEMKK